MHVKTVNDSIAPFGNIVYSAKVGMQLLWLRHSLLSLDLKNGNRFLSCDFLKRIKHKYL